MPQDNLNTTAVPIKTVRKNFLGLRTSVADPPSNSFIDVSNFRRNRVEGWLEQTDPYGLKFADGATDLPQTTNPAGPNYLDPGGEFISNLVWENIHNFFVPDHGGKNITVAVGKYRKTAGYDNTVFIDRFGVFIRPYWDTVQQKWSDDIAFSGDKKWLELTEIIIEKIKTVDGVFKNRYELQAIEYPTNKFQNWIGVFEDYSQGQDHDNYILITDNDQNYIDFFGDNTVLQRGVGSKIILCRNFFNKELPATLSSQIFSLFNEIRLTSGNGNADLALMAGFRQKQMAWAFNNSLDRFIAEQSMFDIWRYAWGIETPTVTAEATDPVPAGTYEFAETLSTDDGQETELRSLFQDSTGIEADTWNASRANLIATDGRYIYAVFNSVTDTDTFVLKKLNLDDLKPTAEETNTFTASAFLLGYYVYGMTTANGKIYLCIDNPSSGHPAMQILEIDAVSFLQTAFTAASSGVNPLPGACTAFNGKLYVITNLGRIQRYTIPGLAGAESHVDISAQSVNLTDIVNDGTSLYVCTSDSPAKIIKVDIASFTFGATLVLAGGENKGYQQAIVGTKLFVTLLTAPAQVVRVDLGTFTEDGAPSPYIAPAGNSYATAIVYDGTSLFIVLDDGYTTIPDPLLPLKIVNRLDPVTMVPVDIYTFINGSADGHSGTIAINTFTLKLLNQGNFLYLNSTLLDKINKLPSVSLTVDGSTKISLKALTSPSAVTNRFNKMRLYVQTIVGGVKEGFFLLKEIPFIAGQGVTWETLPVYNTIAKHFFNRTTNIDLFGNDFNNPSAPFGTEVSAMIGRDPADNGAVRYLFGAFVPRKTYVCGVTRNGIPYRNKVFSCATSGEGVIQYDVMPTDAFHIIDFENGDGDTPKAIGGADTNIVVIKNRSVFFDTFDPNAGFFNELVSSGYGIASFRTLVAFDDYLIWLDYNAVIIFSGRGVAVANLAWLQDLRAMSAAVKEAAIAVMDRANRLYKLFLNGRLYTMEIDSGVGSGIYEWMIEDLVDTPLRFATDVDQVGSIDFLVAGNKIETFGLGNGQQDGQNFTAFGEANEDNNDDDLDMDMNVRKIFVRYKSDVNLLLRIYKNGSNTEIGGSPFTLPATKTRVQLKELLARCSSFRWRVEATTTGAGQKFRIERVSSKVELIASAGDVLTE